VGLVVCVDQAFFFFPIVASLSPTRKTGLTHKLRTREFLQLEQAEFPAHSFWILCAVGTLAAYVKQIQAVRVCQVKGRKTRRHESREQVSINHRHLDLRVA
jgi:hypothetical protein